MRIVRNLRSHSRAPASLFEDLDVCIGIGSDSDGEEDGPDLNLAHLQLVPMLQQHAAEPVRYRDEMYSIIPSSFGVFSSLLALMQDTRSLGDADVNVVCDYYMKTGISMSQVVAAEIMNIRRQKLKTICRRLSCCIVFAERWYVSALVVALQAAFAYGMEFFLEVHGGSVRDHGISK